MGVDKVRETIDEIRSIIESDGKDYCECKNKGTLPMRHDRRKNAWFCTKCRKERRQEKTEATEPKKSKAGALEAKVIDFLRKHPFPKDADVHKWAEKEGHEIHGLEGVFYGLSSKYVQMLDKNEKDQGLKETLREDGSAPPGLCAEKIKSIAASGEKQARALVGRLLSAMRKSGEDHSKNSCYKTLADAKASKDPDVCKKALMSIASKVHKDGRCSDAVGGGK